MDEYGIFNDEGMVEGPFYSVAEADQALLRYDVDDEVAVYAVCPDHEEQIEMYCEECFAEDDPAAHKVWSDLRTAEDEDE